MIMTLVRDFSTKSTDGRHCIDELPKWLPTLGIDEQTRVEGDPVGCNN